MKSKVKTYQVQMIRTSTNSSIIFPVEAQDAFKAIKAAEEILSGWIPVKVKKNNFVEKENNEEE
jgi:hypothetical protein